MTHMPRRNTDRSNIPEDIVAAVAAEQAEAARRRDEVRATQARDVLCHETTKEFLRVTLVVPPAAPDIPAVTAALLVTCRALQAAGRLAAWKRVDHKRTFNDFRALGGRRLSKASYRWARRLFKRGRAGDVPEDLLVQTWEDESLRDAFHWLRVFVAGLAGEGAVLPGTGHPPAPPAPLPETATVSPPAPADRLLFDEHTWTVTLDGRAFIIEDSKAFAIYKFIWEHGSSAKPVTNAEIRRHIRGLESQNAIANHLKKLPLLLYNTIHAVPGVGKFIVLPQREK
jgi:hypothetical protein